jgi:single-strand DNA-binding protein
MNLNKVFLIGNIANDPEVTTTQSGRKVCSLSLATNRFWNTKEGERKQETQFHRIILWERLAEIVEQYTKKGSLVLVEGRIQNRSWEDKQGNKRFTTEIFAESIQLGPRTDNNSTPSKAPSKKEEKQVEEELPVIDQDEIDIKDIPF